MKTIFCVGDVGPAFKQRGMSLIEVMVAVAILAAGLLSLGALQGKSVVLNQSAHYRSIAASLAADLADRIRANRSPFLVVGDAGTPTDFPKPPDFSVCPQNASPDTAPVCAAQSGRSAYLVQSEMTAWNTNLRSQLPNGAYVLAAENAGNGFLKYKLTLTWLDDRTAASGATTSTYTAVIE